MSLLSPIGSLGAALLATLLLGCGNASAPNPFGPDAGPDAGRGGQGGQGGAGGAANAGGGGEGGGVGGDARLGGPCLDVGQCNDGVACAFKACDTTLGRCRYTPDDASCQDGLYCDGVERCDLQLGCVAGVPVGCEGPNACTIVTCDEATHACVSTLRDEDQDGDPDAHCEAHHDCDDTDPTVSSKMKEVCANGKDDNCNGIIDEMPCVSPAHDTCVDPLEITASGSYAMDTNGDQYNYPTPCGLSNQAAERDAVAAILLPAGPPVDLEITGYAPMGDIAVTLAGQCGDASTILTCGGSFPDPMGGSLARLLAYGVGSATQAMAYPVYVTTDTATALTLAVQILPATPPPANDTCGTAAPITPGVPLVAELVDPPQNLATACTTSLGQLVYSFTLASTSNVDVYGSSVDGDGEPAISLRDGGCALLTDELTCNVGPQAHVFRHALPAGTYSISVSATAPTEVNLTLEVSAPTALQPNQSCTGAPVLTPNVTIDVDLSVNEDDIHLGCIAGAVNGAYELDLAQASDVLLVERISSGDVGAVELSLPACAGPADSLACGTAGESPVRAAHHDLGPGSYRAVVESLGGEPVQLSAFVRPAVPPILVPFSDSCGAVVAIPAIGGLFQGNTANANAHFSAGCDEGGLPPGASRDQLLQLTLTKTQRVILDMDGSGYNTLLDVRQGPSCPGTEMPMACTIGFPPENSYLDLTLPAGVYFLQIGGFDLATGPWFLDVHVVDP